MTAKSSSHAEKPHEMEVTQEAETQREFSEEVRQGGEGQRQEAEEGRQKIWMMPTTIKAEFRASRSEAG